MSMYQQCTRLTESHCIIVKYENLITQSKKEIKRVLDFLGESWSDNVMKHHELIGSEVELSKQEWSSQDIVKPINSLSLNSWENLTFDPNIYVKKYAYKLFQKLNYTLDKPEAKIDDEILKNNEKIVKNKEYWLKKGQAYTDFVVIR